MTLNASQRRFLSFHVYHDVGIWKWHFLQTQLRAIDVTEQTATIWRDDLDELVTLGLMRRGDGCADHHITKAGCAALEWE